MDGETSPREPVLTIGLILGGAMASRAWAGAVRKLMREVKYARILTAGCRVQVVFDVPGELTSPPSTGVLLPQRAYKRAEQRIYVAVGLPREPDSDAYSEAVQYLKKAVGEAQSYLERKGISGDLNAAMDVVRNLLFQ
jgi:hypothetical protein